MQNTARVEPCKQSAQAAATSAGEMPVRRQTTIVTVTYGDRLVYLRRLIEQAFAELNGAHIKFVEDAARLVYAELAKHKLAEESEGALVVWHEEEPRFSRDAEYFQQALPATAPDFASPIASRRASASTRSTPISSSQPRSSLSRALSKLSARRKASAVAAATSSAMSARTRVIIGWSMRFLPKTARPRT